MLSVNGCCCSAGAVDFGLLGSLLSGLQVCAGLSDSSLVVGVGLLDDLGGPGAAAETNARAPARASIPSSAA